MARAYLAKREQICTFAPFLVRNMRKKQAQLIDCPKIMRNFAARNRKRLDK